MLFFESIIPRANAAFNEVAFGKVMDPIFTNIINPIVGAMFVLGLFVFVFGVIEMIIKGEDSEAQSKGKTHMLAGAIGMFIMMSAWGIIRLISSTVSGL
ncbi:MAG: hypothetical protein NTZ38_03410 [Candidatus Taylorbacteria bacterium]|nr:hypothetical protein [Candidatus Taylorbacteria bacterium]